MLPSLGPASGIISFTAAYSDSSCTRHSATNIKAVAVGLNTWALLSCLNKDPDMQEVITWQLWAASSGGLLHGKCLKTASQENQNFLL